MWAKPGLYGVPSEGGRYAPCEGTHCAGCEGGAARLRGVRKSRTGVLSRALSPLLTANPQGERPHSLRQQAPSQPAPTYARNNSLIPVFARVFASTRLTITAAYRLWLPSAAGREPATTTLPAGTRP